MPVVGYAGPWVFGIDGGGTSSRIRAESLEGDCLYAGSGGGTNPNSKEAEAVAAELVGLLSGAFASGLDPAGCRAGFIGSAGVDREDDRIRMTSALGAAFRAATEATVSAAGRGALAGPVAAGEPPAIGAGNDAEPALAGALADVEGFLLIAGTGSIAFARSSAGERARSGGWGHFLGDEGSAFWIAFEAIKRGIRSSEGRDRPSRLLDAATKHFGLDNAQALIPLTYWNFDKARIASFAPLVARAAEAGDAIAIEIMDAAASELAALAVSVHDMMGPRVARKRLALYGGLLDKNRRLRAAVSDAILAARPGIALVEPEGDAPTGACRLARELLRLR